MKKIAKTANTTKLYVATCLECGEEDDRDVIQLGIFKSVKAAKQAVEDHIAEYFGEWQEITGGEAWREGEGNVTEVNSGDDRYVRKYTIKPAKVR